MRVVTWNINSVRLRIGLVGRLIERLNPDVICLQETKSPVEFFPAEVISEQGYMHQVVRGMKGYNGVAILSRIPFLEVLDVPLWTGIDEARHAAVSFAAQDGGEPVQLHNFYIPVGGDVPDPEVNPKFAQKLAFYDELCSWSAAFAGRRAVLVGDLNVAPLPEDVWSHRQLLDVITHTPREVGQMEAVRVAGGWVDVVRKIHPQPQKLYSWWSYRARDWAASDRGRRLDHIWVTQALDAGLQGAGVLKEARGWERPSDHAPVWADLGW